MRLRMFSGGLLIWILSAVEAAGAATLRCASIQTSPYRSGFAVENFIPLEKMQARIIIPGVLAAGDGLLLAYQGSIRTGDDIYEGRVQSGRFMFVRLNLKPVHTEDNGRFPGFLYLGERRVDLTCLILQ